MRNYLLEFIVFLSGAVVMVLELVAARIFAPFLGTSLIVWSSLIAIILGALSLGYYLGGRLADKKANYKTLASFFLFASILVLLTILINTELLTFLNDLRLPLQWTAILATVLLFGPLSVLLGMVSPYALRLRLDDLAHSGRTAGNLYAISTLGSIVGTLAAGFYLIPFLGNFRLSLLLVFLLFFLALLAASYNLKFKAIHLVYFFLLLFLMAALLSVVDKVWRLDNLVLDVDSSYNRIIIYDTQDADGRAIRRWQTDKHAVQSAMFLDDPVALVHDYTKAYAAAEQVLPKIDSALMIGGAAYSYPKYFLANQPQAEMTVVEIDPTATQVAKDYFFLEEDPRLHIVHEDARYFLQQNQQRFDVIYMDAFLSAISIPYQLTTLETVQRFYDSLDEDGLLLTNLISGIEGEKGLFLQAEYQTYKMIFPQVYLLQIDGSRGGDVVQNLLLIASKSAEALDLNNEIFSEFLGLLWEKEIDSSQVEILTDDHAPVDYYLIKNL